MNTIWLPQSPKQKPSQPPFSIIFCGVCVCVHRCNWSKWFLTHSWSRWSTAWQQSGGGWGSSTLRSLQTYWAAARLSQVQAAHPALCKVALGDADDWCNLPFWCFQENGRSTRMPWRLSGREWRAWSWCCHRIQTTKSAPLGARSWPGWRMWPQFLQGVYKQADLLAGNTGTFSPYQPPI